jgi:hypothetical protein
MISANAPEIDIVPLAMLRNLCAVVGSRLKGAGLGHEAHSLYDLLTKPELLSKHGVVILGDAETTTGFGKSQFAKRLALEWSKAMCRAMNLSADRAVVVVTNTIDAARDIKFLPGMAWVLDEFEVADREQVIYMSGNMLKVLFSRAEPCSLRCRQSDLSLPTGVAVIVTGNAESPEEWVADRCKWSAPIQRKCIQFQVKKRLCADEWVSDKAETATASVASTEVLEAARKLLSAELNEARGAAVANPARSFWNLFNLR